MKQLKLLTSLLIILFVTIAFTPAAWAFCGFYVAKADAKLFNQASQVVIARDSNQTVLTMANDFQGEVKDFAIVIPVPTVLKEKDVKVAKAQIIEHLDAFSAPRLVEYFDADPCTPMPVMAPSPTTRASGTLDQSVRRRESDRALGVTIESRFNVGEYDILILSAKESGGLETWLNRNGYKIPRGAKALLKPYIRQQMKFFVAKVNLDKFEKTGYQNLRPLQIAYKSPKFMLPIRLGMINSTSEQDLVAYILSPKGQVEVTNYRTVKIPSNTNIPLFVKAEFTDFYKSMFQTAYTKEDKKVAFLEYAWDMGNCDPCSAEPLTNEELKEAGVFWLDQPSDTNSRSSASGETFMTRLHVRYSRNKFPEDLIFQETASRESFQGRYVMQHPYTGELKCQAGKQYKRSLGQRFEKEAQNLAQLTNWNIQDIRQKMKTNGQTTSWLWKL
jgi:hypothetical protein